MRSVDLAKLKALYERIERVHTLELARASAEVHAAEDALSGHAEACRQTTEQERAALARADGQQRHLLAATRARAARTLPLLQARQVSVADRRDAAAETRQGSRLAREQIAAVFERAQAAARLVDGRRTQAQMDDRFAARAAWQRGQDESECG